MLSTLDEVNSPKLIDTQNVLDYTAIIVQNVLDLLFLKDGLAAGSWLGVGKNGRHTQRYRR